MRHVGTVKPAVGLAQARCRAGTRVIKRKALGPLVVAGNPVFLKPSHMAQFPNGWIQATLLGYQQLVRLPVALEGKQRVLSKLLKSLRQRLDIDVMHGWL